MRKEINLNEYVNIINEQLKTGILLNTDDEKFNSMVIAWGNIGYTWNFPTFTVYVRENRYTKKALDNAMEFTISVPMDKLKPEIMKVCGSLSGKNVDKEKEANLTLVEGDKIKTRAIKELPLTLECKVLYTQKQDLNMLPQEIKNRFYPQDVPSDFPRANMDAHTMYIAEIINAYILE